MRDGFTIGVGKEDSPVNPTIWLQPQSALSLSCHSTLNQIYLRPPLTGESFQFGKSFRFGKGDKSKKK